MTKEMIIKPDCWNILVVDDVEDIHKVTENAFFEEEVENKEINFISEYTEKGAKDFLKKHHNEISVMILDMVMENNGDEGLNVLKYLLNKLKNTQVQTILRTGYSEQPEVQEIRKNYPQVVILEKGETSTNDLIQLVKEAIIRYSKF